MANRNGGGPTFGYSLSTEEHRPMALVDHAARAEEAGFSFAMISDHYHPWVDAQGHSPFAWAVLGGIARATKTLRVGTGVTCPIMRYHPALVAQFAATVADMMPGRFFLGLGSGENLNEHVYGDYWPAPNTRQEMLVEAIEVIRQLWQGGWQSYEGTYYTVDDARLYTLPEELPLIMIAGGGPKVARLAAKVGDGFITTQPDPELIQAYEGAGGGKQHRYGQVTVCWAVSEAEARKTAHHYWPIAGIPGPVKWETKSPRHFDQLAKLVTEDAVAKAIACGPDPKKHAAAFKPFIEAGFDHIYVHQVGPDQEGFFRFYEREVLPLLEGTRAAAQR